MKINTGAAQRASTVRDVLNGHVRTSADGTRGLKLFLENGTVTVQLNPAEAAGLAEALGAGPGLHMLHVTEPAVLENEVLEPEVLEPEARPEPEPQPRPEPVEDVGADDEVFDDPTEGPGVAG